VFVVLWLTILAIPIEEIAIVFVPLFLILFVYLGRQLYDRIDVNEILMFIEERITPQLIESNT